MHTPGRATLHRPSPIAAFPRTSTVSRPAPRQDAATAAVSTRAATWPAPRLETRRHPRSASPSDDQPSRDWVFAGRDDMHRRPGPFVPSDAGGSKPLRGSSTYLRIDPHAGLLRRRTPGGATRRSRAQATARRGRTRRGRARRLLRRSASRLPRGRATHLCGFSSDATSVHSCPSHGRRAPTATGDAPRKMRRAKLALAATDRGCVANGHPELGGSVWPRAAAEARTGERLPDALAGCDGPPGSGRLTERVLRTKGADLSVGRRRRSATRVSGRIPRDGPAQPPGGAGESAPKPATRPETGGAASSERGRTGAEMFHVEHFSHPPSRPSPDAAR